MTGKLTAIGIISMAVLLTGTGCVEAATTAWGRNSSASRGASRQSPRAKAACRLHGLP